MKKVTILGAGSYGTSLAHLYANKHDVVLYGRNQSVVSSINEERRNKKYLPDLELNAFRATTDREEAITHADALIFSIPTQKLRVFLEENQRFFKPHQWIINTAKGIEEETHCLPHQIFNEVLGPTFKKTYFGVSGPTFAKELILQMPSGASLTGFNPQLIKECQNAFSLNFFRLYSTDDVMGVELAGALKNVYAIATGICVGLKFGLNTQSGLLTRCLHEMTTLGVKMGANPLTFQGLSGIGDLMLTCFGALSRNRTVGVRLGEGEEIKDILNSMKSVAEGVYTARSVQHLKKEYDVEMPNASIVYQIIDENLKPLMALDQILKRELKEERLGVE